MYSVAAAYSLCFAFMLMLACRYCCLAIHFYIKQTFGSHVTPMANLRMDGWFGLAEVLADLVVC